MLEKFVVTHIDLVFDGPRQGRGYVVDDGARRNIIWQFLFGKYLCWFPNSKQEWKLVSKQPSTNEEGFQELCEL